MRGTISIKVEWFNGLKLSSKSDINNLENGYTNLVDMLYRASPYGVQSNIDSIRVIKISMRAKQGEYSFYLDEEFRYDTSNFQISPITKLIEANNILINRLREWKKHPYNINYPTKV